MQHPQGAKAAQLAFDSVTQAVESTQTGNSRICSRHDSDHMLHCTHPEADNLTLTLDQNTCATHTAMLWTHLLCERLTEVDADQLIDVMCINFLSRPPSHSERCANTAHLDVPMQRMGLT